jgi:RecA-family ATPase
MVYNFAVTCSAGKSVLGLGGGRKIKTLLVDNELHEHELSSRTGRVMEAILGHKDEEGFQSICLRGENIDINQLGAVLQYAGAEQFDLIVLDALYRFLPKGISENDNAAMMGIYNKLDQYAKMFDVGIVVVHHANKGAQVWNLVVPRYGHDFP